MRNTPFFLVNKSSLAQEIKLSKLSEFCDMKIRQS